MKIVIPFLATVFCAAISLAQEESASPVESTAPTTEEKASATVEETPAAKPAESIAPAAETKPEAATSSKAAASPAAKKEATPASTTKATTAAAPMNTKGMGPKELENSWEAAVAKHDAASVQPMIASDFIGVYWDGKVQNKSAVLAQYKKDKDIYTSARNEKLDVRNFGPNLAVVVGTAREKGTGKDGKAFDRTYRFTDTWMMRGGQWQCIASQVMKIKG